MSTLPADGAPAGDWLGLTVGERTVAWTDRDPILFALAVGARADDLDLVFEDRLRVLPGFALTLAQWAPDVLGAAGAWEVGTALHGAQSLTVLEPLPASGELTMAARVTGVWDKGAAAVYDLAVESDFFIATWSLFAPGRGGFGGERGAGRPAAPEGDPAWTAGTTTADNAALLYRLLGDRHHIHVDPVAAARIDQPRPILHGLATLAAATLVAARETGVHPADLTQLEGRFASPVFPGEPLVVRGWSDGALEVATERGPAITAGRAVFG
ncbi:MaoC/PaaZ C-terminal domain-containing protein [Nocardioides sp. SLBN-35]|uniref:MaoC/PaaZ C-terminal domain-containing protein n=1 Tax=Nocardioides sp. SLBN-35 TaxID=2768445 RepID=UPI0011530B27|nr:MaoC/PaaZ C-terminal domain-containing protein [Nocardioides sp. SLBN-35]TQK71993.1 MaoC dehydratase-like protein [Nocardioides sp. SLBN-35]